MNALLLWTGIVATIIAFCSVEPARAAADAVVEAKAAAAKTKKKGTKLAWFRPEPPPKSPLAPAKPPVALPKPNPAIGKAKRKDTDAVWLRTEPPPTVPPKPQVPLERLPKAIAADWSGTFASLDAVHAWPPGTWRVGFDLGHNVKVNQWVLGVEGGVETPNLTGNAPCVPTAGCALQNRWTASVNAILGYPAGAYLPYAGVGVAVTSIATQTPFGEEDFLRGGLLLTGGLRIALDPNLSAKFEFRYLDFGSLQTPQATYRLNTEEFRIGFIYKFPPPPATAWR